MMEREDSEKLTPFSLYEEGYQSPLEDYPDDECDPRQQDDSDLDWDLEDWDAVYRILL
jgi:hypothetical protein